MSEERTERPSHDAPACVPQAPPDVPADSTAYLVTRAQAGDAAAQEQLFARFLPALRRWARGRLPVSARDVVDTLDIVQDAAIATLRNLERFTPNQPGAFMAYLREAVNTKIKDNLRRIRRHPPGLELFDHKAHEGQSPLEEAIGREQIEKYEAALRRLSPLDRTVLHGRLELHQTYEQIAQAVGNTNANATRARFVRALERLVRGMEDHER